MITRRDFGAIVRVDKLERMRTVLAACVALMCATLAPQAIGTDVTFKCKNDFVRLGDSKYAVLTTCGDPEYKEVVSGDAETKVEDWVYDSRSGRKRILRFRGGRLADIRRMSR